MDLYIDVLAKVISNAGVSVTFPNLEGSVAEQVESESLKILQKIKAVIVDESLSDFECIEEIVLIFEELDSGCRNRHDFG